MGVRRKLFSVSIADCRVEAIASRGGNGGQNKNRRHTAIRLTHEPSGATSFSAEENSQIRNKQTAFVRLAKTAEFMAWVRLEAARLAGEPSIEDRVEAEMAPRNLRVEVRGDTGQWVEIKDVTEEWDIER